jgi:hypothetical protein
MQLQRHALHFSPTALAYESCAGQSRVQAVRIDPPEGLRGRLRRWMGGMSWAASPVCHYTSEAFGEKP